MTRTHRTETYNQAGQLVEAVETPWARGDYIQAIAAIEGQITPRRIREAVLGLEGATAWLSAKESDIAALRSELNGLA
jgi:hypothetical protein